MTCRWRGHGIATAPTRGQDVAVFSKWTPRRRTMQMRVVSVVIHGDVDRGHRSIPVPPPFGHGVTHSEDVEVLGCRKNADRVPGFAAQPHVDFVGKGVGCD